MAVLVLFWYPRPSALFSSKLGLCLPPAPGNLDKRKEKKKKQVRAQLYASKQQKEVLSYFPSLEKDGRGTGELLH